MLLYSVTNSSLSPPSPMLPSTYVRSVFSVSVWMPVWEDTLRGHLNWLFVLAHLQGPSQSLGQWLFFALPRRGTDPDSSEPSIPRPFGLHSFSYLSHLTLLPGEFVNLHKPLQKSVLCGLPLIIQRLDSSLLSWQCSVFVLVTFSTCLGYSFCEPWCLLCT